jgi:hypothetical protein
MYFKTVTTPLLLSFALLLTLPFTSESSDHKNAGCEDTAGLIIIGEVENVTFKSKGLKLKARIDTGAETSSLGVVDQQPFERDGKKWLRFSVKDPANKKLISFEKPIVRTASIKRHGAEDMKRPVVKLKILLGKIEMERQFTLADRSKYTFPVLIGRNVLSGKYLVDVNRKFSAKQTGGKEE